MQKRPRLTSKNLTSNAWTLASILRPAVLLFAVAVFVSGASVNAADSSDDKMQSVLIEKLTGVYLNLAPEDNSKVAVTLRLADLHAERARRLSMKELEQGCSVCQAGVEDRKKALRYYNEVVTKVPEASVGKVLTQIGHLYELNNQDQDAVKAYTKVLQEQKSPAILAAAHLSLAELHFKKRRFAEAQSHYAALLEIPAANSKGLAAYRQAWCEFNLGKIAEATNGLIHVLKTPELLNRSSQPGVVAVDTQFQEEVSRDLATFIARATIDSERVNLVYSLSPESARLQNVTYLASELERLGQPKGALEVWRFIQGKQSKPVARLEGQLRIAQILLEQKNLIEAAKEYDSAMALWGALASQCGAIDCKELKSRTRRFVVDWNRLEKKAPSEGLYQAYERYLQVFADDLEARVWAVQVARELKKHAQAFAWNELVIQSLKAKLQQANLPAQEKTEASAQLESSLLGGIEIAELDAEGSKNKQLLDKAYASYLDSSLDKKKQVEVRYQKANLVYNAGQMADAAEMMRAVAIDTTPGSADLKKQAADLALDALVILKDDARIQAWSKEFAQKFPQAAAEFVAVGRKSVLNQAVAVGSGKTDASAGEAWQVLAKMDLTGANTEDRIAYHKNRLILAEKLNHFREARESAEELLRIPTLTEVDRQFALARKVWLAELNLDFDTALKATEKLSMGGEENKKYLKMALFADLANKDSKPYFQEYLKHSKDEDSGRAIAARLVRESVKPDLELEKQRAVLMKDPELYARLALEIFASSKKLDFAKKTLTSSAAIAGTASGKVLQRQLFFQDFSVLKGRVQAAKMDAKNQRTLAASLKGRVALLESVEKMSVKAVESGDWTSQLVSLNLLAHESKRFYDEILSLPVPQGLSGEEEQQYLGLLSQQAAPHLTKSQDVEKKMQDFWSQNAAIEALEKSYQAATGALRELAKSEVLIIADAAPETMKTRLQTVAASATAGGADQENAKPSLSMLETARQSVRENPLSRSSLEALLALEKKAGRVAMVGYLESRIQSLESSSVSAGGTK